MTLRRAIGPIEKSSRLRSRAYLDQVQQQPCCRCLCAGPSHPHHVKVRGRRDDTFDLTAIPLCFDCHRWAHEAAQVEDPAVLHRLLGNFVVGFWPKLKPSQWALVLRQLASEAER